MGRARRFQWPLLLLWAAAAGPGRVEGRGRLAGQGREARCGDSPAAAGPQRPNNARGAGPGPLPGTKRSAGREPGAGSRERGRGTRAPAAVPQSPHPAQARIPAGTKGRRPPPPPTHTHASPPSPGRSRCPSVRSLRPSVRLSLSPLVSLLVPHPCPLSLSLEVLSP